MPSNAEGGSAGALVLEIVEGSQPGTMVTLDRPLEIGRAGGADLQLDDAQVSSRHVRLEPSGAGAVATDLASLNGTYVNEQPISGPQRLSPGDRVRVGLTVIELRSQDELVARPSAVAPAPEITRLPPAVLEPVAIEKPPSLDPSSAEPASTRIREGVPLGEAGGAARHLQETAIAARETLGATRHAARENVEATRVRWHRDPGPPEEQTDPDELQATRVSPGELPPFAPPAGQGSTDDVYEALAGLVDTRVKQRTRIAMFVLLSVSALVVLIVLGAR